MKPRHIFFASALAAALVATSSHANDQHGPRNGHRGPPQVAIDACASLSEGDACSFTGRNDETVDGTCFAPPDHELACKPEGFDGPRNRPDDADAEAPNSD